MIETNLGATTGKEVFTYMRLGGLREGQFSTDTNASALSGTSGQTPNSGADILIPTLGATVLINYRRAYAFVKSVFLLE